MTEIRRATFDEVPAIAAVHAQAHFETYQPLLGTKAYALDTAAVERRWRQALTDGDAVLVATVGGGIVGVGHARGNRIEALYLLAARRRRGIGRMMLAHMLRLMQRQGIAEAEFDVLAVNADAIAFYCACGARQIGSARNTEPDDDHHDIAFSIATDPLDRRHP
jgi:ribosomal protein S18 acetylase RimI-like enzyme